VLTNAKVWAAQDYVVERALEQVRNSGSRWIDLIGRLDDWPSKQRASAFAALDSWLSSTDQPTKAVWAELNQLLHKHLAFADAQWAMSRDELATLQDIVRRHQADDVVERDSWLFKEWSVQVGTSFDGNDAELKQLRMQALGDVFEAGGDGELFRLIDLVGRPETVAVALLDITTDPEQISRWIKASLSHGTSPAIDCARVLSAGGRNNSGDEWKQRFIVDAANEGWSTELVATLLLNWPDTEDTWEYVAGLQPEVRDLYWARKYPFGLEKPTPASVDAIQNYLLASRPAAALQASHRIIAAVPSSMLLTMLRQLLEADNPQELGQMTGYYIEHVFEELDKREDVEVSDLAQMEYAYFPIMERRPRKLVIHKLMAQDPAFYMSLITSVFGPATKQGDAPEGDVTESSEQQRAKWRNDYRVLSDFHTIPGQEGDAIDYDRLMAWVQEVRRLGAEEDRVAITDLYIGHMLAHAPEDKGKDEAWPHVAVRKLLDSLTIDDIERGIMTERYNMRGAYSKSLYEGGKQEREIARQYKEWSHATSAFPATAMMLDRIAESYQRDAAREDERAELDKLRDT
jgi:hypothetical protein